MGVYNKIEISLCFDLFHRSEVPQGHIHVDLFLNQKLPSHMNEWIRITCTFNSQLNEFTCKYNVLKFVIAFQITDLGGKSSDSFQYA